MDMFWTCVVFAVIGVALLHFAIHARAARARRREAAGKVATKLTQMGLSILPAVLTDYAEGNYPKLIYDLDHAIKTLLDPAAAAAEFDGLLAKMTAVKISDPNQATIFLKQVATLAKSAGVTIPTV
jgi:hypothetical protein